MFFIAIDESNEITDRGHEIRRGYVEENASRGRTKFRVNTVHNEDQQTSDDG